MLLLYEVKNKRRRREENVEVQGEKQKDATSKRINDPNKNREKATFHVVGPKLQHSLCEHHNCRFVVSRFVSTPTKFLLLPLPHSIYYPNYYRQPFFLLLCLALHGPFHLLTQSIFL